MGVIPFRTCSWQGNDIRSVSLHERGEVEVDNTHSVADELLQPELLTRITAALEPVDGCAIGSNRSDIERQDDGVPSVGTVSPSVIIIRKLDIRCGEVDGRIEIRPVSQLDVVGSIGRTGELDDIGTSTDRLITDEQAVGGTTRYCRDRRSCQVNSQCCPRCVICCTRCLCDSSRTVFLVGDDGGVDTIYIRLVRSCVCLIFYVIKIYCIIFF